MEQFDSPFGTVELTSEREKHIFQFHPEVKRYRKHFAITLASPELVRRSKLDSQVHILYRKIMKKYLAIVIKRNKRNFILTTYITSKIQHLPYESR